MRIKTSKMFDGVVGLNHAINRVRDYAQYFENNQETDNTFFYKNSGYLYTFTFSTIDNVKYITMMVIKNAEKIEFCGLPIIGCRPYLNGAIDGMTEKLK